MSSRVRIWVATAGAGGALASATWLLARETHRQWRLVAGPAPASLDEAVTVLATALALVLCLWLATSTVVALLAHLPGRLGDRASRVAQVLSPALTRRVAAVLVGAAVGGALAPASALGDGSAAVAIAAPHTATSATSASSATAGAPPGPGFVGTPAASVAASPSEATLGAGPGFAPTTHTSPPTPREATGPGWTPTRPVVRPQVSPDLLTASPGASEAGTVVVRRGDTLWDLVRSQLGPGANDAEVAHAWPRWYAANRSTIGPDPGLILPGQVLHAPAPESMQVPR